MSRPLRLGLLSTARINDLVLAAVASSERVEVVAVASRDAARARAYAGERAIPRAHGSYEALLADGEVDAVYVSLPNRLHHEWSLRALEAGKHVLCEKPFSRRPAEVEEAFGRAEAAGLVLMEGFMYRHHPQTALVRRLVEEGAIGRPRLVRAAFHFLLRDPGDVRARPELDGGALMDVGCYCVSGARLLLGEPELASGAQVTGPTGVDTAFCAVLRFPDGALAQLDCSFLLPRAQRLEALGEEGRLVVEAPWRPDWGGGLRLERDGEARRLRAPEGDAYRLQLENLADAAAGRAAPLLGREDALAQARVLEALYRAAGEGRHVALR